MVSWCGRFTSWKNKTRGKTLRSANVLCAFELCLVISGDEVMRVVWWWGGACNTCQSPCPGNVKVIDRSLVVTAVPPTGPLTLKLPISKNQNVILALPSPSVSTQHPYPWHPSSHAAAPGSNSWSLLIVWGDVDFLGASLFRGHSPSAYVMSSFLFLLWIRTFLLQFLALELRPSILKPNFYLWRGKMKTISVTYTKAFRWTLNKTIKQRELA